MTLLPSASLANYLNCFRADPTLGQLFVPVLEVSPSSPFGTVTSQPLGFDNLDLFIPLAVKYIQQRLDDPSGNMDSDWEHSQLGPQTALFVNSQEGRSVMIDSKGDTCLRVNETRRGVAVEVSSFSPSSRVSLGQGLGLHGQHFRPHALYTIEFGEPGIMGLRKFLGLSQKTPINEVALILYNRLDFSNVPSFTSKAIKIISRPFDFHDSALSPQLLHIWELAVRLGNEDNPSTKPLQNSRSLN